METVLTAALALIFVVLTQGDAIERRYECDLEVSLCGWRLGESKDGRYNVGRAEANWAPGPSVDAAPGTAQGQYVYLNYTAPPTVNGHTLLSFPTYQYVCGLSLSYYVSATLDMYVLRVNIGETLLPVVHSTTDQWQHWARQYNVSSIEEGNWDHPLNISTEWAELGEAEQEEDLPLVAAVDDITLTFCLPCDFDLLPQPGNLWLDAPPAVNVSLGSVTNFHLNASSPLCPSLPLIFTIDAVEPPALADILSVGSGSGAVTVDGTGPHLLAAGTLGYINVSVHVRGSNYKQISPPYKATATIAMEQDPVIRLHDTPAELTVEVDVPFSLQLHAAHVLPSTQTLFYRLYMTPSSLQALVAVSNQGEVTGVIARDTISDILAVGGANMTVGVTNVFKSSLNVTIPLLFPPSPPLSLESNLSYSVSENHSAAVSRKLLATLTLIDPNGDSVSVSSMDWFNHIFELYPITLQEGWIWEGWLFVDQTRLDYENQSSYSLPLDVVDSENSSLVTPLIFHITVKSENEHSPKFVDFSDRERVQASWSVGAFVTAEVATDQDEGPAGEVAYAITAGNEDQFFLIDETGDVRVASSPLLPGMYSLTITASDHGAPPLATSAVLIITVEAVGGVDCSNSVYNAPTIHTIGIDNAQLHTPVGSNVTLYCSYEANPAVAVYKWDIYPIPSPEFSLVYPLSSPLPHAFLLPYQLTLVGVSASDAAFYTCSVTNWCGTTTAIHILFVIDYPRPVEAISWKTVLLFSVDEDVLFPTSVNLSWTPPSSPEATSPLVELAADAYLVQVMGHHDNSYHDITEVSTSITSVLVEGLLPGNGYYIRVVSVNRAGATPSENIRLSLPPTTPKLASVDTRQEANFSLLVTWDLAYDGGYPISQFTITIDPQSPRARRQKGGVVYHVEPSVGSLLSLPLKAGRRYLVTLSLENQVGIQEYRISEYVGHVDSVRCDFEPLQHCPWRVEAGNITNTESGGVFEASVSGKSSKVILRHTAAGYSCGYGFSYQLWGGAGLRLMVGEGGGVIWEDQGDTGAVWKRVSTSESVDVDYLTPHLYSNLEMVATSNSSGGGVKLDMLFLDFCLPCDIDALRQPGQFTLTYTNSTTLYPRHSSQLNITASLADCANVVLSVYSINVIPRFLRRYVSAVVSGPNISLSVQPIPSDLATPHTAGLIQVSVFVVGSDYGSPMGDMSTAVVGVAEIEFVIEERLENCSDVISCGFEEGTCGWSLGDGASLTDSGSTGVGVWLPLSHSLEGDVVLSREFSGDSYCQLSLDHTVQGAELVATVSGVGVVWTSGTHNSHAPDTANFTFDLQAVGVLEEWNVTLSLAQVWDENGSVVLDNPTLYPCTQCQSTTPSCECPVLCPAGHACPDDSESIPCLPDQYSFLGQDTCQSCPEDFRWSDSAPTPSELENCHTTQHSSTPPVLSNSFENNTFISVLNGTLILNFIISDAQPPVAEDGVMWTFKPSTAPKDSEPTVIDSTTSERYEFKSTETYVRLRIQPVELEDEGTYTVNVNNIAGSDTDFVVVNVVIGARIINAPNDTTVHVGQNATFTCVVTSEPVHDVIWKHDNTNLTNGEKYVITNIDDATSELVIVNVAVADGGEYVCDVRNDHGEDMDVAILTVISTPVVTATTVSPLITLEGVPITLSFTVTDDIPPVVTEASDWSVVYVDIQGSHTIAPEDSHFSFSNDFRTLTIDPVEAADEGVYTLTAMNTAGMDSASIEVDVQCSLVPVVAGLAGAVVVLLLCCLCSALFCLWRNRRAAARAEKRRRQLERQSLMSDGDSVGTAGSLGRAGQGGDRRRWKKYGESSTLMTFMSEDESCGKGFRDESSWLQTVELTHTHHPPGEEGGVVRGLGTHGEVLQNPLYEDEEGEYDEREREWVELSATENDWTPPPPPTTASHF